ncbi:hypothetical protein [Streptomyces chartreusis]|uniref:hypothetical protein n=1 Tax=Streptomyces chartreusis TaxID=1969 RepID=UPI0036979D04
MGPSPRGDLRMRRSTAIAQFDWLTSVDLNTVPNTHPSRSGLAQSPLRCSA